MSVPLPPPDLHERKPDLEDIPIGTIFHRFYPAHRDPIYFDASDLGRFNAPDSSYGVLYTAQNVAGVFAETFLRKPGRTLIDETLLRSKAYVRLITRKPLRLVLLVGLGFERLGHRQAFGQQQLQARTQALSLVPRARAIIVKWVEKTTTRYARTRPSTTNHRLPLQPIGTGKGHHRGV
ncbi:RES domain-containing protein [Fodinicurvata sediminis]|uniref:RES domain-containing protein n=1 Tax=Fodinicurvata sediminis TaxID=1121832 RepID=UPI0003B4B793|nr:RES domain-containing protein [Fodinicurvata sediminis]